MISAIQLKSTSKTLYYVQFSEKFQLEPYKNFSAFCELSIGYYADVVLSKKIGDLQLFLFGDKDANELLLQRALETLENALLAVLEGVVTEETLIPSYMLVATTLSEIVDNGMFLTESVPEVFTKTQEGGVMSSVFGGVKFLAKTILQ